MTGRDFSYGKSVFLVALLLTAPAAHAAPNTRTIQNILNGADAVSASAGYGRGITFGVVDTGIAPSVWFSPSYNGQGLQNIDTVNSGVCLSGTCRTVNPLVTPTDTLGHGTFVASEIVGGVPNSGYQGMAPAGKVISVQVFNSSGSGNSLDAANGIRFAADRGAAVINLSLGPAGGNAAQQAAFYQSLASAVNYAASKNVYVVFAAGNSAQPFSGGSNITGFTDAAIQRMLIMGSTNANKQISSFSDTAGTASFISTTGKVTKISSLFLTADGESIWGASNSKTGACAGYGCVTQMSGTSMAAPQGTGAIGLLEAKWAILKATGTAAQILTQTATDIGTKGADSTYGSGFMNLVQAFQPMGTMSVVTTAGKSVPVSTVTGTTLTSGALGALSNITSQLKSFTAFDAFQRNFSVDLSGLVATKPATSAVSQSVTAPKTTTTAKKFADGTSLAFGQMEYADEPVADPVKKGNAGWFAAFTDAAGTTVAAGSGFPASASFAAALWGNDSPFASQSYLLGVSSAVASLAEGGTFAAYGTALNAKTRLAFSWSQTPVRDYTTASTASDASAYSVGLSTSVAKGWRVGTTFGLLDEKDGMLGTNYASSPVNFGDSHKSLSMGVSSAIAITSSTSLMLDAALVRTDGASMTDSLITSVTPLYARSFGASLVERDMAQPGDNVSLTLRAPLRVVSGSAMLTTNSVDAGGNPIASNTRVGLKPTGSEMDLIASYQAPMRNRMSWNMSLEGRNDAGNVAGATDLTALTGFKLVF